MSALNDLPADCETAEETSLVVRVRDAFNRHGAFTARVVDEGVSEVELRHLDTGELATWVWRPGLDWRWSPSTESMTGLHLPSDTPVVELVAAVAASVLAEAVTA